MKYPCKSLLLSCALLVFVAAFATQLLCAQNSFIYTNDNQPQNTVSGFAVGPNGALTPVPGSPFSTGGSGAGGGLFGANSIGVATVGKFLFVANSQSADVSVFAIDSTTGTLTLAPGSPFPIQTNRDPGDLALDSTPDGRFLMVASNAQNNISTYSIDPSGTLSSFPGSLLNNVFFPDGIKISPSGKFLAVAGILQMFSIDADGNMAPLSIGGSDDGFPASVDIDCSSSLLYAGRATAGVTPTTIVDGYHLGADGSLNPVAGSPFEPGVGLDSSSVLLSRDDKTLFVSNQFSNGVTAFRVATDGSLSLVPGSPFLVHGSGPAAFADGMATSPDGKFLYVANDTPSAIAAFQIANDGTLTQAPGSPFFTGNSFGLMQLTSYPAKSCTLTVNIRIKPPAAAPVSINPDAGGKITVAILSTPTFDAVAQVDPTSLTFGHSGSEASLAKCSAAGQDVNNDGLPDLVCQFNMQQTALVPGDNTAVLKGATITGRQFQGSETIRTVPQ